MKINTDTNDLIKIYKSYTKKKIIFGVILIITIFMTAIIAISIGSVRIRPSEVLKSFLGQGIQQINTVIWQIRLPRVLVAIIAGAGLSVSGCVMQNNLKNSLASPSTLGISNAAAFGANIAIIGFGAGNIRSTIVDAVIINNPYIVTISAFTCSMIAVFIVLSLAKMRNFSPESIILAGVALGSLFSAGTILIQYFAQDVQIAAAVFWTFGDLGRASWDEILILTVIITISLLYFIIRRWDYNSLNNGEESAKSLGVNVERVRLWGMLVSSIITAAAVSFLGMISFIGLISPQIVRRLIGGDQRFLIPISAMMGSLLLLISDTIARTIIAPVILPVGVITSFLGAPLFLYLLIRGNKNR